MRNKRQELYEDIRLFRDANKRYRSMLSEEQELNKETDAVPYTQQDQLLGKQLDACKQQFGANFVNVNNPMLYYPANGNVTLSGEISGLNDAKFQFIYKDDNGFGCYLWLNKLQVTDDNIQKIHAMNGVFKNWRDELSKSGDIKPVSLKNKDNPDDNNSASDSAQQQSDAMKGGLPSTPGDDLD